jgi:hypothetical protein
LRSTFGQSSLVRQLAACMPAEAETPGMDVAERLSLWLNAFDAIGLQQAQQAIRQIRTAAAGSADAPPVAAEALSADLQRVRSALAGAIAQDPRSLALSPEGSKPWQQRHLELQRQMEQMIQPLREHVQQALARGSPRLRQLAALDAVMAQALAAREQAVLPTVTTLLERRFVQLRAQANGDGTSEGAATWLDDYAGEWRQVLLAELDLRLQPVLGLIEALGNELKNRA